MSARERADVVRWDGRLVSKRGEQTCQQERIAGLVTKGEDRLVSKGIAVVRERGRREELSATGMNFHREERKVLSGPKKEEFQQEGNVVSERKGRIVSDGKGWLSARKERAESSMTGRGRGRGR